MTLGGALAAGDPVQAWDTKGNLFFMGNNFNRGFPDGRSAAFRDNTGDVWVATYAAGNPADSSTDGSHYLRTVILARNTFGLGSFNDKTGMQVDQTNSAFAGNVYAAWSDFHGAGCNEILFALSTDHGATFSAPMKLSGSICGNQGPNIGIGPSGQVYVSWFGQKSGSKGQNTRVQGAAFAASLDGGRSFGMADVVVPFNPFTSSVFSGNGARDCGDPTLNCPTGQTFPRFDLAQPSIATDGGAIYMAFMANASGQGQSQFVKSTNGGATWSAAAAVDPQGAGHQFFPWITASSGTLSVVYYDSRSDPNYSTSRAPCNDASGNGYPCLDVWYSSSTDGGSTWTTHIKLTDQPTNPNLEQFGGRLVPFFGDYIMVSAVGSSIAAAWTDQRDAVVSTGMDGNDPKGDPHNGGACTSVFTTCFDLTGGEDQNIYTQNIS
jgi:hypothetical protein